ncbi:MAG: hypothetical protein KAS04_06070 [Candidatus Aenigmarchaeota archaeon]|nr:hypothetical protein [Candidatus Aenigmarchaeota archaeon]
MKFEHNCPRCGTDGKIWNESPETFMCPKCSTFYSRFGLVLETEMETYEVWT